MERDGFTEYADTFSLQSPSNNQMELYSRADRSPFLPLMRLLLLISTPW